MNRGVVGESWTGSDLRQLASAFSGPSATDGEERRHLQSRVLRTGARGPWWTWETKALAATAHAAEKSRRFGLSCGNSWKRAP
jgi:hypothetical protein